MLSFKRKKEEEKVKDDSAAAAVAVEEVEEVSDDSVIDEIEGNREKEEADETPETVEDELDEKCPSGLDDKFMSIAGAYAEDKGIDSDSMKDAIALLKRIGEGWQDGTLTAELLEIAIRGLTYDEAVAKAREEGEIAGRNMQIEEKYMRPAEGDGLPHLSGSNVRRNASRIASIFDLARKA